MSDRRVHPRSSYARPLLLQMRGDVTWFTVQGVDVSAGGFGFVSDYEMRRGESLGVSVEELPGMVVAATVRHVKSAHGGWFVGIEFDEELPAQMAVLLTGD